MAVFEIGTRSLFLTTLGIPYGYIYWETRILADSSLFSQENSGEPFSSKNGMRTRRLRDTCQTR
jgi:hypothetical protein